jgi:hypothetical protein
MPKILELMTISTKKNLKNKRIPSPQLFVKLILFPLKLHFGIMLFKTDFLDHETDLKNIF